MLGYGTGGFYTWEEEVIIINNMTHNKVKQEPISIEIENDLIVVEVLYFSFLEDFYLLSCGFFSLPYLNRSSYKKSSCCLLISIVFQC